MRWRSAVAVSWKTRPSPSCPWTRSVSSAATGPVRPACSRCSAARPTGRGQDPAQGRIRLPAAGPSHRRRPRQPHRCQPRPVRPRHRRGHRPAGEAAHIAMEEGADERTVALLAAEESSAEGGYHAESEARSLAAGLGLGADRMDLPLGVLSGGERRRAELPGSSSPARTPCSSTSRRTTSTSTPRTGCSGSSALSRRPPRDQPRPRTAGRGDHSCAHLDRSGEDAIGHIVEYKEHLQPVPHGAGGRRGAPRQEGRERAKEINRLQSVVDRFGAKASKAAMHTASRSASGGSRTSGSTHRSTPRR